MRFVVALTLLTSALAISCGEERGPSAAYGLEERIDNYVRTDVLDPFQRRTLAHRDGRVAGASTFVWTGAEWIQSERATFSYDQFGQLITAQEYKWDQTDAHARRVYEYSGELETITTANRNSDGDWVTRDRTRYEYSSGRLAAATDAIRLVEEQRWLEVRRRVFEYDGDRVISERSEAWFGDRFIDQSRVIYGYQGNQLDSVLEEDFAGGAWVPNARQLFFYDAAGLLERRRFESFRDGAFVVFNELRYSHDENGVLDRIRDLRPNDNTLIPVFESQIRFTQDGSSWFWEGPWAPEPLNLDGLELYGADPNLYAR